MKKYVKVVSLFLAALVMLSLTACGKQMSEEEIKEACIAEAENFVGGYLSNTGTGFLNKYAGKGWTVEELYNKLEDGYTGDQNAVELLITGKVADYILENATFEVDQYSFVHEKNSNRAELCVNVTILPPKKVFERIEEYVKKASYAFIRVEEEEATAEAAFPQAISMISDIQPVTASIPITFIYNDENDEWLIDYCRGVMGNINSAE